LKRWGRAPWPAGTLKDASGNLTGATLQEAVFAGTVNPGNIVAVREILTGSGGTDSAVFTGLEADYTVTTTGGDGTLGSPGSTTTVTDNAGTDGTDTVRNVERLVFADTVARRRPSSARQLLPAAARQRSTSPRQQAASPPASRCGWSTQPEPR
jgi:hypothetical protein